MKKENNNIRNESFRSGQFYDNPNRYNNCRQIFVCLVILFFVLLSSFYLYFIFDALKSSLRPECVEKQASFKFEFQGIGVVPIVCKALSLNEIGDYLAGSVSLLATVWLVLAFVWQAMELSFQRREFIETNRIAATRAQNEDLWRALDYYEVLRVRLSRVVNTARSIGAALDGVEKPTDLELLDDLRRWITKHAERRDPKSYSELRRFEVADFNRSIELGILLCSAISKLENDPAISEFLPLVK